MYVDMILSIDTHMVLIKYLNRKKLSFLMYNLYFLHCSIWLTIKLPQGHQLKFYVNKLARLCDYTRKPPFGKRPLFLSSQLQTIRRGFLKRVRQYDLVKRILYVVLSWY